MENFFITLLANYYLTMATAFVCGVLYGISGIIVWQELLHSQRDHADDTCDHAGDCTSQAYHDERARKILST